MSTDGSVQSPETFDSRVVEGVVSDARAWVVKERAAGTLVGEETLWREAYRAYLDMVDGIEEGQRPAAWACIASALVFDTGKVPLNQKTAARQACDFMGTASGLDAEAMARRLHDIALENDADPGRIRGLLAPGVGYPWVFPRALWARDIVARSLEAMLAPLAWAPAGPAPDAAWLQDHALRSSSADFLTDLEARAPEGSVLRRSLGAIRSFVAQLDAEGKDAGVVEAHTFISALAGHGLSDGETAEHGRDLLDLQEAVVAARW